MVFKKILKMMDIDRNDVLMLFGLGGIAGGLWMYDPWVSISVTGAILFLVGFFTGK